MDYINIVIDIVKKYGWEFDKLESEYFGSQTTEVFTIYNNKFKATVSFFVDFSKDGRFENSFWTLDILDEPLSFEDVDDMVASIKRIWYAVDEALENL